MIKSNETGSRQFENRDPRTNSESNPKHTVLAETPFEINGQEHNAQLLGFSQQGGWLATSHKPSVGSLIRIGRIAARVVDHFQDGVAIEVLGIDSDWWDIPIGQLPSHPGG
ncbi:MAG TPA: hypothetical protein VJR58_00880 [Vineibacter sp.]|nr:hypothetical protein [Vineibacter sp.]